jgi:HTH-type transcriptional regulator/antitoxin HigA
MGREPVVDDVDDVNDDEPFLPDWVSPPGDTMTDLMEKLNLTVADFAAHLDWPLEKTRALLRGEVRITLTLAHKLSELFGASAEFWVTRDEHYCADHLRLKGVEP